MGFSLGGIVAAIANPVAALGTAGAVAGDLLGYEGQMQANRENRQMFDSNQQFQERMSSTAHQREVEDLKKAGLNPILSANAGASTPSGSGIPQMQNAAAGLGASVRDIIRVNNEIKKQGEEIALLRANKKKADAETARTGVETTVLSKQVPEAEMKYKVYDRFFRPWLEKALEKEKATPRQQHIDNYMKDFDKRIRLQNQR